MIVYSTVFDYCRKVQECPNTTRRRRLYQRTYFVRPKRATVRGNLSQTVVVDVPFLALATVKDRPTVAG